MRRTQFWIPTQKNRRSEAELPSHQWMVQSGMIAPMGSGLYYWLPYGLQFLNNLTTSLRRLLSELNALELAIPLLQPIALWERSGRVEAYGKELFTLKDQREKTLLLGPTHEEAIAALIKRLPLKENEFPKLFFQMGPKFRDEIRPRGGVIRAREFLMKDAYSFHKDYPSLNETYLRLITLYETFFQSIGLQVVKVAANPGEMGGSVSHEFHALSPSGEDSLAVQNGQYSLWQDLSESNPSIEKCRSIEVGHTFQLQDRYTAKEKIGLTFPTGFSPLLMGCYGIGISRTLAALIEQRIHKKGWMRWPSAIAPFLLHLIPIASQDGESFPFAEALYQQLAPKQSSILFEDRANMPVGFLLNDADLLGLPYRLIVGGRSWKEGKIEFQSEKETLLIPKEQVLSFICTKLASFI